MRRLKILWDTLHPELNHFKEKDLKQQATYIQQKHYILETQTVGNNKEENQIVDNTAVRQDEEEDTN